ncbi:MAG: rhodanese-like domain-containing protein [Ardenticatenia bacterium]|nr:MAG: rhodanese-like domain-containing protein [Ardenticatenia bacterium]
MFRRFFQPAVTIPQVRPQEVAEALKNGNAPVIIDVRTVQEWAEDGHIPEARHIPLSQLGARVNEIPRDRPVVIVCRSGNRSQMACEALARGGFDNVQNLAGGIIAWKRAGLPTVYGEE